MRKSSALKTALTVFSMGVILFFSWNSLFASGGAVDHSIYADLLQKYVKDGVVDYHGFDKEESRLDEYLKLLEKTDPKALIRNERFAFYINAYNVWTLKLILTDYPGVGSIKELGTLFRSPWKKKICRIDGDIISLDDIEHRILRPTFKDPRFHFAINCASKGCPPLISEPYTGSDLDRRLDISVRAFINDPKYNYLRNETLYVSSIFKWFSEDFGNDILSFIYKYASTGLKSELDTKAGRIKVDYLEYDWSLNGK